MKKIFYSLEKNNPIAPVLFFGLLLAAVVAIGLAYINNDFVGEDAALYIAQAKSLVMGTSKELYYITNFKSAETFFYSIGFPLLLSPIYYFFGLNLFVFKIYELLFFLMALLLLWKIFYNGFNNKLFLYFFIASIGLNKYLLNFLSDVTSDLPYLCFSLLVVYCFKKIIATNKNATPPPSRLAYIRNLGFGLLLSFAYNIRSVGMIVAVAIFVFLLIIFFLNKKKYIVNDMINISSIFIPFLITNFIIKEFYYGNISNHYYTLVSFRPSDIINNIIIYYHAIGFLFDRSYDVFSAGLFLIIGFWGMVCHKRADAQNFLLYFLILFFNLLLLVFYISQIRFLIPLMPYFYYFFFIGIENIHANFIKSKNQFGKIATILLAIIPLTANGFSLIKYIKNTGYGFRQDNDMQYLVSWLMGHTGKDEVLCYSLRKILRLKANSDNILRPVIMPPTASNENLQQCDYFIYDKRIAEYYKGWEEILASKKQSLVATNNVIFIYKIK